MAVISNLLTLKGQVYVKSEQDIFLEEKNIWSIFFRNRDIQDWFFQSIWQKIPSCLVFILKLQIKISQKKLVWKFVRWILISLSILSTIFCFPNTPQDTRELAIIHNNFWWKIGKVLTIWQRILWKLQNFYMGCHFISIIENIFCKPTSFDTNI